MQLSNRCCLILIHAFIFAALHGSGIEKEHCRVEVSSRATVVLLMPVSTSCYVNGLHIHEEHKLRQGDIVQFGDCLKFRFNNPKEAAMLLEKRRSGNFSAEVGLASLVYE